MHTMIRRLACITLALPVAISTARAGDVYVQTNLITSDQSVVKAQATDPNLIDPWGLAFSGSSPLWVSDQGSGLGTIYNLGTAPPTVEGLKVQVPNLGIASPEGVGPTGQVFNDTSGFLAGGSAAKFIFDNLDGSISAWSGGTSATIEASVSGASFTGLAIAGTQIYAADQNSNNVDIFNSSWAKVGSLTAPNLPSGFTAFNVQYLGGVLYVTYANPLSPTGGIVDEFKPDGTFITQLIDDPSGAHLDTPWGLAIAPAGWGKFGGDLLVGNNDGDGTINAYTLGGVWQGQIVLNSGQTFSEGELWGMAFGNGGAAGSANTLYFAAGLPGATAGLIGSISVQSVPEPSSAILGLIAAGVLVGGWRWKNRRKVATT